MKKLFIIVFLSINFFANAQEAKPTKQETIDYITSYILKADSNLLKYVPGETGSYRQTTYFSTLEFLINGSVIKIKQTRKTHYVNWARDIDRYEDEYTDVYEIDLSKVDYLAWGTYENKNGSIANCGHINFHMKGDGPNTYKGSIELVGQINEDSQIFKAFNHLRKLCGAPEPIKF